MKLATARCHRPAPKATNCRSACKKRWPDHKSAVHVLQRASISRARALEFGHESHRSKIRAYQCDACGGWHTTSREYMSLSARGESLSCRAGHQVTASGTSNCSPAMGTRS